MKPLYSKQYPFTYIVFGFFLHLIAFLIANMTGLQFVQAFVGMIGWWYIIKGFRKFSSVLRIPFHGFYRFLFVLYIILCAVMICRGYTIDYPYQWISIQGCINYHLFSPYYILPYFMPFVAFIPVRYYKLGTSVRISYVVGIITIILFAVFYKEILASSLRQARGFSVEGDYSFGAFIPQFYINVAVIVLFRKYISNKVFLINCIGLSLSILVNLIAARRGGSAIQLMLFVFNLYFLYKSVSSKYKILIVVISAIIIIGCVYLFSDSDVFNFIKERGLEDTRSGVDKALLSQMNDWELIFGKGLNGRYYYPLSALEDDYLNGWRYASETGFYSLVLHGGYLLAFVYIAVLLLPALKGVFLSKNLLCKALGFYIILSLIELYPFGWPSFNFKFLMIWMGVSLCYNRQIRSLNDRQIKEYFFS